MPIPAGTVVELSLPESPTTGLRWSLPEMAGIDVVEDFYDHTGPGVIGASARRVFSLRLVPGRYDLHLNCAQAWDPAVSGDIYDIVLVAE